MLRYVDHAIIGVADLAAAARDYEALLGVAVSPGGTHPGVGTHNRLVVLDPAYIELIARLPAADPDAALISPVAPMLARLPGPIGFALASDDLAADVAETQARGVAVAGPYAGRLEGPDGSARGWQVAWVEDDPRLGTEAWRLPFLIQHDATGRARLERLARPDSLRPHPLGAARLVRVTVAAHSLAAALRAYALAFGLVPAVDDPDDTGEDAMLRARTARLPLADGAIVLAEPLPASGAADDVGPLARGLAAAGEGLYSVTIAVADLQAAVDSIRGRGVGVRVDERDGVLVAAYPDPAAAHGARVELTQM